MSSLKHVLRAAGALLLRILGALCVAVVTSVVLFIVALVLTAFPCLAVFSIVQLCGPVLRTGLIWLAAAAAVWVILEVLVVRRTRRRGAELKETELKETQAADAPTA